MSMRYVVAGSGPESQRMVTVHEVRVMGHGVHAGVELAILTNGKGTSIGLTDDEALEVAHALRIAVQGGVDA